MQQGIFAGRTAVRYPYGRYGYTRGGGKRWHGGLDVVGLDDATIRMPFYGGKTIRGTVVRARCVQNKRDATWEWGWYVCVKLDANQTPDAVNYLYFCHCERLLVRAGQRVQSGDALGIMGNTGNAAGGYKHCHLEVRAAAAGTGLDPTVYAGVPNAVGEYGSIKEDKPADDTSQSRLQVITIGPVSQGDADAVLAVCRERGLTDAGLYKSEWA